jgi:hypothetical protein
VSVRRIDLVNDQDADEAEIVEKQPLQYEGGNGVREANANVLYNN